MSQCRILVYSDLKEMTTGYHFFDDIASLDKLVFQNHRQVEQDHDFIILKESICQSGIKVPVQLTFDREKSQLRVLAGERRIRAAQQIKLESPELPVLIPCLVLIHDVEDHARHLENTVTSVVSNLMSKGLSQVDKMRCFKQLADLGMSKKEIARCCGKDRKTVERSLELSQFDENALSYIEDQEKSGLLKARHVEIIGQKLKNALKEVRQEVEQNTARTEEPGGDPSAESLDTHQQAALDQKEQAIRESAFRVLQEEVRRREQARRPKSEEVKAAMKERRENTRTLDMRELKAALLQSFSEEEVSRVLEIINHLDLSRKEASATQQVSETFLAAQQSGELNTALTGSIQ